MRLVLLYNLEKIVMYAILQLFVKRKCVFIFYFTVVRGYSTVLETVYTLCFRCYTVLQHRDGASCLSYLHCTAYSIAVRQWVICHIFYSPTVQLRESSFYASYGIVLQYSSETGEFGAS